MLENHRNSSTREFTGFQARAIALENHWNSSTREFIGSQAWAITSKELDYKYERLYWKIISSLASASSLGFEHEQ